MTSPPPVPIDPPYARPVRAAHVLIAHEAGDAGSAVETTVRVDADGVLDAAAVVHLALVDVVADLEDDREGVGLSGRPVSAWRRSRAPPR